MALKRTSEIINISGQFTNGAPATFGVSQIDLQLNPLDQEVFVVVGVKIDWLSTNPHTLVYPTGGWKESFDAAAITTTRPSVMPTLAGSNCLAYAARQMSTYVDSTSLAPTAAIIAQSSPTDTPDTNLDYLGIVATSDMFVAINADGTSFDSECAIRVYGYRAKADAATYAALVQSEVLSN